MSDTKRTLGGNPLTDQPESRAAVLAGLLGVSLFIAISVGGAFLLSTDPFASAGAISDGSQTFLLSWTAATFLSPGVTLWVYGQMTGRRGRQIILRELKLIGRVLGYSAVLGGGALTLNFLSSLTSGALSTVATGAMWIFVLWTLSKFPDVFEDQLPPHKVHVDE